MKYLLYDGETYFIVKGSLDDAILEAEACIDVCREDAYFDSEWPSYVEDIRIYAVHDDFVIADYDDFDETRQTIVAKAVEVGREYLEDENGNKTDDYTCDYQMEKLF